MARLPQGITSFGSSGLTGQISVSGRVLDWSSGQPIDVVIVKGGPNANIYRRLTRYYEIVITPKRDIPIT